MRTTLLALAAVIVPTMALAQNFPILNMPGTIIATNSVVSVQSAALNMATNTLNFRYDPAQPLNSPTINNTQTASGSLSLGYTPPSSGTSPILTGATGFTNQAILVQALGNYALNTVTAPVGTSSTINSVQTNNASIVANANNLSYSIVSGPSGTTYTSPTGTTTTSTSCNPCIISGITIGATAVGNSVTNTVTSP